MAALQAAMGSLVAVQGHWGLPDLPGPTAVSVPWALLGGDLRPQSVTSFLTKPCFAQARLRCSDAFSAPRPSLQYLAPRALLQTHNRALCVISCLPVCPLG